MRTEAHGDEPGGTGAGADDADLEPIETVARRLGLPASAIRYYEQRGLVAPASRRSGRRWYGPDEIRRLAVIRYWQRCGLMSLDEIGGILAGPAATRGWTGIVEERIADLRTQADRLTEAREYLEHVLAHHRDSAPDGCRHFEARLFEAQLFEARPDDERAPRPVRTSGRPGVPGNRPG